MEMSCYYMTVDTMCRMATCCYKQALMFRKTGTVVEYSNL